MATVAQDSKFFGRICNAKPGKMERRALQRLDASAIIRCLFDEQNRAASPSRPRVSRAADCLVRPGRRSLGSFPEGLHDRATGGKIRARQSAQARAVEAPFCRLAPRRIEEDER